MAATWRAPTSPAPTTASFQRCGHGASGSRDTRATLAAARRGATAGVASRAASGPGAPRPLKDAPMITAPTAHAPLAVAPMMDWTDRHCRIFHRTLSRHALLYTEMVTAQAVVHGDRERLLGFSPVERARRPATRRQRSRASGAGGADRGGVGLRAGRPQLRLPLGPGAVGDLRGGADGASDAGGRLRGGDDRGGAGGRRGDGEMPHRRGRAGPARGPSRVPRGGARGGRRSASPSMRERPG